MNTFERSYRCLKRQIRETNGYSIRTVSDGDIESIRVWRNAQMDVLRQMQEITPEAQERYFRETIWPDMAHPHPRHILVSFFLNGLHIGYGALVHISWEHQRAEVSFLLDPARTSDEVGYARDFSAYLSLIKDLAFHDLTLNRIFTETYAFRNAHISVLENAGFRREGVLKEHLLLDGKPTDSIIHGYLNAYETP